MKMGAPPKAKQGKWHAEARRLRDEEHWTYQRIAALFEVTAAAVYFVCNPDKRVLYSMKKAPEIAPRGPILPK
jgi:hypothetical protein